MRKGLLLPRGSWREQLEDPEGEVGRNSCDWVGGDRSEGEEASAAPDVVAGRV